MCEAFTGNFQRRIEAALYGNLGFKYLWRAVGVDSQSHEFNPANDSL